MSKFQMTCRPQTHVSAIAQLDDAVAALGCEFSQDVDGVVPVSVLGKRAGLLEAGCDASGNYVDTRGRKSNGSRATHAELDWLSNGGMQHSKARYACGTERFSKSVQ